MASVKVAVRVRPFNKREMDMNAISIIEMEGKKTRICNSKLTHVTKQEGDASRDKYKDFTFDYSYWSFDTNDSHFASQEQVFEDLGMDVIGNAFQGYNACVFAYGQTGSGKTHTMMGSQSPLEAQGLIPRICMNMFNRMSAGKANGTTYSTEVSYLEIYNERVKDLLTKDQTHNLRVREHPRHGPYVEELSTQMVTNYAGIQEVMNRGNANRTTASTNMNDVSSRSHAIFTMMFSQASFVGGLPSETVSKIHLVDLAGSERADASGATGKRLKEGAHINKSLVTLGSVISALAEYSQAQHNKNSHQKTFIPYRDSVLTWLLKDSLGGNAKTIMIATISPADCNYGETLSTLRYANRAKNIINKPTINEDPNVKLIRELRAEIDKLKLKLGNSTDDNLIGSPEVLEEIHKKEAKEKSLTEEWTEKWKETQKILMEQKDLALRKAGTGVVLDSQMPHLIGIDDDLLSTGITLYHLKEGETKIGSEDEGNSKHDILLKGLGLESQHCSIVLEAGVATLVPFNGALCSVNGQQIDKPTRLFQGYVIQIGRTSMFRYNDPAEAEKLRREGSNTNLNQSRFSFLSRSVTDLSESLSATAIGEENTALEEKRKQLEAEETRLQKESQELFQQKKLLEEQKYTYQQLQQEKEEAWKAEQLNKSADIQSAQKELEERKHKLEHEYAAHRRRLAEDWKRLEQQEQETLASLQSKEADLKKRRELLEWEVDQEMEQIEAEAVRVETLKTALERKSEQVDKQVNVLNAELQEKLGRPDEDLRHILQMEELQFQSYMDEQTKKIDDWRSSATISILKHKEVLAEKMKALTEKIDQSVDPVVLERLEAELSELKNTENKLQADTLSIEAEYESNKSKLKVSEDVMSDYRSKFKEVNKEVVDLNNEIEKGIVRMETSQSKIERHESDLELITGQEKLIVSQLAHINSSKRKLLTIIENSTEGYEMEFPEDQQGIQEEPLIDEIVSPRDGVPNSRESSPNHLNKANQFKISDVSPIKSNEYINTKDSSELILPVVPHSSVMKLSDEEAEMELKRLIVQINQQKAVVLECLENDCDGTKELDIQMTLLQDLRSRYLELESQYDVQIKQRWLGYDDDDSTYSFYKNGDTTPGGDSELDESEALSSVTDNDDHIQMLVDQGVEKRLKEIFEQLKSGKQPNFLLSSNLSRRNFRRSMPTDLNNRTGSAESDDEASSSQPNAGHRLPRSVSMSSGLWTALGQDEGVIPGVLDIYILNYMLRGAGSRAHYDYEILIITQNEKWSILRRFSKIRDLYKYMKNRYGPKVSKISFPRREIIPFSRKSEAVARVRKPLLEAFFKNLIQVCRTIPACPLHNCDATNVKAALIAFSPFFEKGIFETTKHGTS